MFIYGYVVAAMKKKIIRFCENCDTTIMKR